jgi:hypothetical protein
MVTHIVICVMVLSTKYKYLHFKIQNQELYQLPTQTHSKYSHNLELSWRFKTTEICIELTFHSPSPTPLLPAPTLSAGEHKVSGGESRVSRQVGLPHTLRAPRSKPKMASLYFWRPSQGSCLVAMAEPPVSYLESTAPAAACEIAVSIGTQAIAI